METPFGSIERDLVGVGVEFELVAFEMHEIAVDASGGRGGRGRGRLPANDEHVVAAYLRANVLRPRRTLVERLHEQRRRALAVAALVVGEYLYLVERVRL